MNKMLKHLQAVYLSGFQRCGKMINLLLTLQLVCRKISYILGIILVLQSAALIFVEKLVSPCPIIQSQSVHWHMKGTLNDR